MNLRDRFAASDDGFRIVEDRFRPEFLPAHESVFAVANGYLGMRGTPEEGTPARDPGVALNGFYESWPIVYPEDAYGLARTGQTIVGAPDGSLIRLFVDDEPFDVSSARILAFERTLDMRTGVLSRHVEFETARGHRLQISSRRLASLEHRHLVVMAYEVTTLDGAVEIAISSELVTHAETGDSDDPRRGKGFAESVLVPVAARAAEQRALLQLATRNSGLELACGMEHEIEAGGALAVEAHVEPDRAELVVLADLEAGESLRLSKYLAYHWAPTDANRDLVSRVDRTLDRAARAGFEKIEADQHRHMSEFWHGSDIEVGGPSDVQLAVRFNLFQLMQATARGEGLGVPAKGVTGRGYEGHYFWDTEVYVVPFLAHTNPRWAKQVLEFRCGMLDSARERAREVGHRGALYPWRTISGEEASAWYAAGTAQYHINADIAYAMHQYNRVTGDLGFMLDQGAAERMDVPRHEELGIVLQDERFLERKRWDFENTPKDSYPLLLNYHPLELYRHQVIKQTDVVLATYLVGHHFTEEEKRRTFDYYDPLTTGDSSLSACVQSVIASEVGYADAALDYFHDACGVDLLDLHHNTADGIHIASCGGTWLALVAGFGGLRDSDGEVRFRPHLPAVWERLRFRVQVRGQLIEVDMTADDTTYRLLEGRGLLVMHEDEEFRLGPDEPVCRPATPGAAEELALAA